MFLLSVSMPHWTKTPQQQKYPDAIVDYGGKLIG